MRGLAVIDGDLVVSGGDLVTFSGAARIKQDLDFALHDEYGVEPMNPYWGSILDRFIGQPLTSAVQQQVLDEVQRVLNNYISVQSDLVNRSVVNNVRGPLNTSDVIRAVTAIDAQVNTDSIRISVQLQTMAYDAISVTREVTV